MRTYLRIIVLTCCVWSASLTAAPMDSICVVVNDTVITQSQIERALQTVKQQAQATQTKLPAGNVLYQQVIEQLVDTALTKQAAKEAGISISENQVDAAIAQIAKQHQLSTTQLRQALQAQGINYVDYQAQIREQLLINELQQQVVAAHLQKQSSKKIDNAADFQKEANAILKKWLQDLRNNAYIDYPHP